MAPPWTISPVPHLDLVEGELVTVTLSTGETKTGMVSALRPLPDGTGWTLTLWADPVPAADDPT